MDLEGKVAIVTGGSRGIGAAIARELAFRGADIALTYQHHAARAADVVSAVESVGRQALAIAVDAEDPDSMPDAVAQTVARLGCVDVLVNNAAICELGPVETFGVVDFDRTMAVNVRAPFLAAKSAAEQMGAGGRIITIGSNMIGRTVFPGFSLYSMSKTALVGLTKGLSRDLGPTRDHGEFGQPRPDQYRHESRGRAARAHHQCLHSARSLWSARGDCGNGVFPGE